MHASKPIKHLHEVGFDELEGHVCVIVVMSVQLLLKCSARKKLQERMSGQYQTLYWSMENPHLQKKRRFTTSFTDFIGRYSREVWMVQAFLNRTKAEFSKLMHLL